MPSKKDGVLHNDMEIPQKIVIGKLLFYSIIVIVILIIDSILCDLLYEKSLL